MALISQTQETVTEQYKEALKALLPTGVIWDKVKESESLEIKAELLAEFDLFLQKLVEESNVATAQDLLLEWAELHDVDISDLSIEEAQKALCLKKNAKGGTSVSYFEQLCKSYGVIEPKITECLPVLCGVSECGSTDMCGQEETVYMWFANVPTTQTVLREILTKYKPSHTALFFESED